jgi:hypothetical protein
MHFSAGVDLEQPAEEIDPVRSQLVAGAGDLRYRQSPCSVFAAAEGAIEKAFVPTSIRRNPAATQGIPLS